MAVVLPTERVKAFYLDGKSTACGGKEFALGFGWQPQAGSPMSSIWSFLPGWTGRYPWMWQSVKFLMSHLWCFPFPDIPRPFCLPLEIFLNTSNGDRNQLSPFFLDEGEILRVLFSPKLKPRKDMAEFYFTEHKLYTRAKLQYFNPIFFISCLMQLWELLSADLFYLGAPRGILNLREVVSLEA